MRIACLETDQPAVEVDVRCSQPLPEHDQAYRIVTNTSDTGCGSLRKPALAGLRCLVPPAAYSSSAKTNFSNLYLPSRGVAHLPRYDYSITHKQTKMQRTYSRWSCGTPVRGGSAPCRRRGIEDARLGNPRSVEGRTGHAASRIPIPPGPETFSIHRQGGRFLFFVHVDSFSFDHQSLFDCWEFSNCRAGVLGLSSRTTEARDPGICNRGLQYFF